MDDKPFLIKSFNEHMDEITLTVGEHYKKIFDELPWRNYYGEEFCDLFEHLTIKQTNGRNKNKNSNGIT